MRSQQVKDKNPAQELIPGRGPRLPLEPVEAGEPLQEPVQELLGCKEGRGVDLVAAKDVDEPVLVLEDRDGGDGVAALVVVACAREPVREAVEPLLLRAGRRLDVGGPQRSLLVGDFVEGLVEDDGLVEATLLLGGEGDKSGCGGQLTGT